MVFVNKIAAGMAVSALVGSVSAHPGEKHDHAAHKREVAVRNMVASQNRRALDACTGSKADIALKQRAVARRNAKVQALRKKRGLDTSKPIRARDEAALETYLSVDHQSSSDFDLSTDAATLFAQNATCVIVPETTIGPYWVSGELIREDITEDQDGVPVHVEMQFVDTNTCEGASDMLIDFWHCNAMGIYSGVSATGQGGLDSTFLRGVQETDSDGIAAFDTIYPGHYTSRTNHIHVKTTTDSTIYENGTYALDGVTHHVGQLFFDQGLTTLVEATDAYSSNEQELTLNEDDQIAAVESTDEYDPFLSYVMLGDDVTDGLLMWITVGVDMEADYSSSVSAAAAWTEDGGVEGDSDGGMGGGPPDGEAPTGEAPTGAAPTGEAPTSTEGAPATESTTSSSGGSNCRAPGRRRRHI